MESKLMPCKVADLIDVIISHNERVGIWVEYRNGDESGCALLWKGMAHELPRQHLNSRFVRIFGLIPETIMDADIINIIVEIPTPMNTSEPTTAKDVNVPTTGEIVRALRCIADNAECKDCRYKYPVGNVILCDHEQMNENAADRLESQEREIVGLTELNKAEYVLYKSEIDAYRIASESLKLTILRYMDMTQTLTARAEQAERERDAAIKELTDYEDALYPTVEDVMRDLNTL